MNLEAFYEITYGLYIVSSTFENKESGFICNAVMQVTANPCQLAVAASKDNFTTGLIQKSKKIAICALSKNTRLDVIGTFGYKSGRELDKFASVQHIRTEDNLPVLTENVLAWFHGEVVSEIDLGSHILFVAKVDNCEIAGKDHDALTYTYYREVLKGKSPKSAPTYINPENINHKKKEENMKSTDIWVCEVCGYEYDPIKGDPDSGIAPGTTFEDLPEDWCCPLCGVDKSNFTKK